MRGKENERLITDNAAQPSCLEKSRSELPRVLGLWDMVSIVVGGVIGSGIFLVPAEIARELRAPLLILAVWVVGGLLSYFGAVTFSEMCAALPRAGGMYNFLKESYGSLLAFLFGWTLFLVIDSGTIATLTVAFSSNYLPHFVHLSPLGKKIVSAAFIVFLVTINYIGVRWGANLQNLLTVIKFSALAAVCGIVFVLAKGNPANFIRPGPAPFSRGLFGSFGVALVACLWAYKGWESATFSAGEVKRPERNLPLGLLAGTLIVIGIYLLTNFAYLYAMPAEDIARSPRIASDVMNLVVGPVGASIIAFIILFSITGAANQTILCSPRVYFAMARDGLFFKKIAAVHPKFLTPHYSIILLGAWSLVLSLLLETFEKLFTFVVFGEWIFFGLTAGAVIILRRKRPDLPRPYRTLGYPIVPVIFIIASIFIFLNSLIHQLKQAFFGETVFGLLIILLGIPAYLYWRKKPS